MIPMASCCIRHLVRGFVTVMTSLVVPFSISNQKRKSGRLKTGTLGVNKKSNLISLTINTIPRVPLRLLQWLLQIRQLQIRQKWPYLTVFACLIWSNHCTPNEATTLEAKPAIQGQNPVAEQKKPPMELKQQTVCRV